MALKSLSDLLVAVSRGRRVAVRGARTPRRKNPRRSSVTRWTDKTELFAEYPPLAVGATSRFAIHLTRLDTFKALTEGNVEVRLEGGVGPAGGVPRRRAVPPGHLRRRREAGACGQARARDRAASATGLDDEHRVGASRRASRCRSRRAAAPAGGEDAPGISFLKEQQWSLDFGTALVSEQAVRESIRVPARSKPDRAAPPTWSRPSTVA